jgi:hypothetical protein
MRSTRVGLEVIAPVNAAELTLRAVDVEPLRRAVIRPDDVIDASDHDRARRCCSRRRAPAA